MTPMERLCVSSFEQSVKGQEGNFSRAFLGCVDFFYQDLLQTAVFQASVAHLLFTSVSLITMALY
jgi:hypothetical protein